MKTVKKPTKAHKNKKVVKAHQGMAHVPKSNTTSTKPTKVQPTGAKDLNEINALQVEALNQARIGRRVNPNIVSGQIDDGSFFPSRDDRKEFKTAREVARRIDGNKVVQRSKADTRRRTEAEIKRRGGRDKLIREQLDYFKGGRKGKRPARIDPYRGMDERARRRAMNAAKSEYDETERQVRKDMGTQRKPVRPRQPTPQPIQKPIPMRQPIKQPVAMPYNPVRLPKDFGGRKRKPRQPRQQPPLLGTPVSFPQRVMTRPEVSYPQQFDPRILQLRNKGGVVKKKYAEVKTLKQGGYVSRAKYGSVDNLKKKK